MKRKGEKIMMNYEEFTNEVKSTVERKLGASYEVSLNKVTKINTIQTALTIREQNDAVAQNIYLEDFYEQYHHGINFYSIIDNLIELRFSAPNKTLQKNLPTLTDFEAIKDKIAFKIINTNRNRELLTDVPHNTFFNLSIVLYCILDNTANGTASFLIHNNHLDIWNTDFDSLLKLAFENTQRLFPMDIQGIQRTMFSICTDTSSCNSSIEDLEEDMFYVLTNKNRLNGFGCILYPNLLETFAKRFGSFYILPSSLHEALLVPVQDGIQHNLLDMVKEVNATQVSPEDFLADSVYFYNSATKQIEM